MFVSLEESALELTFLYSNSQVHLNTQQGNTLADDAHFATRICFGSEYGNQFTSRQEGPGSLGQNYCYVGLLLRSLTYSTIAK